MATKPALTDLDLFDTRTRSEQGEEVQIQHPVHGPTDIFISVLGRDSEKVRAHLKRMQARKRTTGKSEEKEGAEFLASITLGWRGISKEGKSYEFSFQNAVDLYMSYELVSGQVAAFVFDQTNFLKS